MKALVASFRFPPYNAVGGVSVGKTVKNLVTLGHEVRVVTARDYGGDAAVQEAVDPVELLLAQRPVAEYPLLPYFEALRVRIAENENTIY